MSITTWPLADRPREKLLTQGASALTEAELLAILLHIGAPGQSALDLARRLLSHFGGLKPLAQATAEQFLALPGLGQAKLAMVRAAFELGKRCQEESFRVGEKLGNSLSTKRFLASRLSTQTREIFACLFLNNQNDILAFEELFQGTLREAAIYPREILKRGLTHNAAKIILSHNHPSGNPKPSPADRETTRQIQEALALVDIQVLDHIIIGRSDHFSFAEAGWL